MGLIGVHIVSIYQPLLMDIHTFQTGQ
jgi:hypothetical protein